MNDNQIYFIAKFKEWSPSMSYKDLLSLQYMANQILEVSGCGVFDKSEHPDYEELVAKYKK